MKRSLPILIGLVVVLLFALGHLLRQNLEIEFSPQSIQRWVGTLGWWAPLIFVLLIVFRQFLLLPSMIILPVGGLCFGATLGTILGAAGILGSGVMKFALARGVAREWMERQMGSSFQRFSRAIERAGPMLVVLTTAHPTGPMSPFHWASGFSTVAVLPFIAAVTVGGIVRAFAYSFFGSTLIDPGSPRFLAASAVLLAIALLPLAHPRLRRLLLGGLGRSEAVALSGPERP